MTTSTPEKANGLKGLKLVIEKVMETIENLGNVFKVLMAPKVITAKDDHYCRHTDYTPTGSEGPSAGATVHARCTGVEKPQLLLDDLLQRGIGWPAAGDGKPVPV